MSEYDSTEDTLKHIENVQKFMVIMASEIIKRSFLHDESKLKPPEKELYDKYTPLLSSVPYMSDEYKQYLSEMGEALQHHYKVNQHHPEHFENGIDEMNLLDIVEMFCDWKAATLRVKDGNIASSLDFNKKRFNISNQFYNILLNTIIELDW